MLKETWTEQFLANQLPTEVFITSLVQWTGGIQPGEKPGEISPKNQEPAEKQPDFRSTRWKNKVVANPVKISMNKAKPVENSTCRLSPVIIPCDPVKILVTISLIL